MLKKIDGFSKNVILIFFATSLGNFFNLVYQLLIAHRLTPVDFASFNSLLSIFMVISAPLTTLQPAVAKHTAEFNAKNQAKEIEILISGILKITIVFSLFALVLFLFISRQIVNKLQITSISSGYILAGMLSFSGVIPALMGSLQGLELFNWLAAISVISGAIKLISAFCFIWMGFNIAGALGAFLASNVISVFLAVFPLRNSGFLKNNPYAFFEPIRSNEYGRNFKNIFAFLLPVAISSFCFMALVSLDMVLVKYLFTPEESGIYSLAQIIGKIFLFLPGGIAVVMFPRLSALHAKNMSSSNILKKALFYSFVLCAGAFLFYNIFPIFTLKLLTGKANPQSVVLGRLFGISMTFFSLVYILIFSFLSKKDFRFIKYLVSSLILQLIVVMMFHKSLIAVQLTLCINAILLFLIHLALLTKRARHAKS